MKTAAVLVVVSSLLVASIFAAPVFAQTTRPGNPLPPPGINDPGVKAVAPAATPAPRVNTKPAAQPLDLKPQALPAMQDGDRAGAPRDKTLPQIRVRKDGDNSVQEYSRNGQIYMVVVTPPSGIQQTYTVNPDGKLVDEHGQKRGTPTMYKVMEWGKAPPPAQQSTPEDDGN